MQCPEDRKLNEDGNAVLPLCKSLAVGYNFGWNRPLLIPHSSLGQRLQVHLPKEWRDLAGAEYGWGPELSSDSHVHSKQTTLRAGHTALGVLASQGREASVQEPEAGMQEMWVELAESKCSSEFSQPWQLM